MQQSMCEMRNAYKILVGETQGPTTVQRFVTMTMINYTTV